ncbi:zinc metalloprotease HtpX [Thiotrichales bacterium 19X7-9]|nr:zinc metalloprotease HtpX [Thiotrichales bacterium 19X7-9]
MNHMRTFILLAALTALLFFIGGLLGGRGGLIIALIFAAIMNLGAYWFSDKIVLKIYRAKEVEQGCTLYRVVSELASRANLPMPKVYIIDSQNPNAFATGRSPNHASVAATTGLINILTENELKGVMAHELGHVLHRDTLTMAITATIAGAISGVANMFMWLSIFRSDSENNINPIVGILLMILAPLAASLIQFAISRSREYVADETGARLCGNPEWLASALLKLESKNQFTVLNQAETHPSTAHLFIVNPLKGKQLMHLFSTHPPIEDRVKRLREFTF